MITKDLVFYQLSNVQYCIINYSHHDIQHMHELIFIF